MNKCADSQAPHLVIFTGEDGQVCEALILAEGETVCHLNEKSSFTIFNTLLSVYFTFDYIYPKASSTFLCFLQHMLIKKSLKGQKMTGPYVKIMKTLENFSKK